MNIQQRKHLAFDTEDMARQLVDALNDVSLSSTKSEFDHYVELLAHLFEEVDTNVRNIVAT